MEKLSEIQSKLYESLSIIDECQVELMNIGNASKDLDYRTYLTCYVKESLVRAIRDIQNADAKLDYIQMFRGKNNPED